MPYQVQGDPRSARRVEPRKDVSYKYPAGLKLEPGSELHNKLVTEIMSRAQRAHDVMSERYNSWNKIDRTLTAYQVVDDEESEVQDNDSRRPVSIVFPYSYVMLETLLTYMVMAFFQDPIFRYEGVDDKDVIGAMLLELCVRVQTIRSRAALNLHTWFRDGFSYGLGVLAPSWHKQMGWRRKPVDLGGGIIIPSRVESVLWEGNVFDNIDPYHYLPDPAVAVHDVQRGQYVGWVTRENYMTLLSEETQGGGFFNVRHLEGGGAWTSVFGQEESDRTVTSGRSPNDAHDDESGRVDVTWMYVTLIPSEWNLGDGQLPEKWLFALAGDSVIIRAEPIDHDHGLYPVCVIAPDYDGYSATPVSRLEVLYGLQHILDFLFNSHVANVRKAINDMLVVDPYLINVRDIEDPQPGKIIRMRRPAWGRGVKDAVMQLNVQDVTRGNIADSEWIVQWMQKIAAADDSAMGVLRKGGPERLTSAEFEGTSRGQVSRLERMAKVVGLQGMQPLGYICASHTQQYQSEQQTVGITGEWRMKLAEQFGVSDFPERLKFQPSDLWIDYDVLVKDGTLPGGNFQQTWVDLYKIIVSDPMLMQQFDTFRIFAHIATGMGAKNVEDFRRKAPQQINTQTMPDQQVMEQAQAGNVIPLQVGNG